FCYPAPAPPPLHTLPLHDALPISAKASTSAASTASESAAPKARPRHARSPSSAVRASRKRSEMSSELELERVRTRFPGSDADQALDGNDPHFPVTDLAGARGFHDLLGNARSIVVVDQNLELDLRH